MTDWGKAMFVTPGVVVDGKLVTNELVDINLNIRILLGSSYYEDWEDREVCEHSIRWATRWTGVIRGTRPPPRARKSATSAASTAG